MEPSRLLRGNMAEEIEDISSEDLSESTIAVLCILGRCKAAWMAYWNWFWQCRPLGLLSETSRLATDHGLDDAQHQRKLAIQVSFLDSS